MFEFAGDDLAGIDYLMKEAERALNKEDAILKARLRLLEDRLSRKIIVAATVAVVVSVLINTAFFVIASIALA